MQDNCFFRALLSFFGHCLAFLRGPGRLIYTGFLCTFLAIDSEQEPTGKVRTRVSPASSAAKGFGPAERTVCRFALLSMCRSN